MTGIVGLARRDFLGGSLFSASEMTYIVSGGALNSTHSLCERQV